MVTQKQVSWTDNSYKLRQSEKNVLLLTMIARLVTLCIFIALNEKSVFSEDINNTVLPFKYRQHSINAESCLVGRV